MRERRTGTVRFSGKGAIRLCSRGRFVNRGLAVQPGAGTPTMSSGRLQISLPTVRAARYAQLRAREWGVGAGSLCLRLSSKVPVLARIVRGDSDSGSS